ncbi:ABC transporter permease [Vallitalea pronyensis]|uniref:ABC transporter permease n=1 Tax=Vallitalea pronyensis TaxID=1348613 RepID=A0A8J8MIT4_9FIRM|nr:ABC transporter permease [Vallitalea pronyensis]QUI22440.1 ABC transporter permease [Vallitalea pronyensis]
MIDNNRALLLLILLACFSALFAPNFANRMNITTILISGCMLAIISVGFTLVFILAQIDLSIGATAQFCGMLCVGLQPTMGWWLSLGMAVLAGAVIGLFNGIVVAKFKIHSFIATIGTMTIIRGVLHLYSDGGTKSIDDYTLGEFLETGQFPIWFIITVIAVIILLIVLSKPDLKSVKGISSVVLPALFVVLWLTTKLFSPIVIITFMVIGIGIFFLDHTRFGKGFYVVGGNPETAWLAGINKDMYIVLGFVICGITAALAGSIFAMRLSSMTARFIFAQKALMTSLAAVIIGGTQLTGGKGHLLKSYFGVLMFQVLFNMIGCFSLGFEIQIFINGLILAVVVFYEAYSNYRHEMLKGQRPELLKEIQNRG